MKEIMRVANGWIVKPVQHDSRCLQYGDMYVFNTPQEVAAHIRKGCKEEEAAS